MIREDNFVIAGSIFDGERVLENHAVMIAGGTIAHVLNVADLTSKATRRVELGSDLLLPGFVDLQVNGGGGVLFNDDPSTQAIAAIGAAHRSFGTVGFLPTLITCDFEKMRRAIDAVDEAIASGVPGVLGIHLEGPFLSSKRPGIHNAARFRPLDGAGFDLVTSLKRGVTIVTLAPELTSARMIRRLTDAGVIVCAGHSAADYEQAQRGFASGIRGVTHLYNAMTPLESRAPGLVGAALANDDAWFGIIADGHHVHPAALRIAVTAKPRGRAILVTDAMPCVGTRSSHFDIDGQRIRITGGRCVTADGSLAGSNLTMISAVSNTARFAAIDWFEAARMASAHPARAIGLGATLGRIAPGHRASFVAVDSARRVTRLWVDGVRYPVPDYDDSPPVAPLGARAE